MIQRFQMLISREPLLNLWILMPLYSITRLLFYWLHHSEYQANSSASIAWAFIMGLRFDLATLALVNIPFILLMLFPRIFWHSKIFRVLAKLFFWLPNFVILGFMLADLKYYQFTGSRMTADVFLLKSEAASQSSQLIFHYWHIALLILGAGYLLFRSFQFPTFDGAKRKGLRSFVSVLSRALLAVLLVVTAARGGLQLKVLKPLHAFSSGDQELGILALNSGFTLIRSNFESGLKPIQDFAGGDLEVQKILSQETLPVIASSVPQNVVIFILESYATEFWGAANDGKGYTPFLDSLAAKGLFFKNNFANGRRSIEGLPSVLFGVPSLMPTPLAKSNFQSNRWIGLGQIMEEHGYQTSFFHGAKTGTMYFDAISRNAGIKNYYPLERYPHQQRDFDGSWGIYDEPFFQYMAENLDQHKNPFISVVFSLSSHQPYNVPESLKKKFRPGELKIHRSIQYVDYSVQKFFERADKSKWFANTLFIFTGDHTQETKSLKYDTTLGRYMVPLLFYHPTLKLPEVDSNRITQQVDILPSILHFTGARVEKRPPFGRSVFGRDPGEALLSANGMDWLIQEQGVLQRDSADHFVFANYQGRDTRFDTVTQSVIPEKLEQRLKAYRQLFNNGLLNNTFYRTSPEVER